MENTVGRSQKMGGIGMRQVHKFSLEEILAPQNKKEDAVEQKIAEPVSDGVARLLSGIQFTIGTVEFERKSTAKETSVGIPLKVTN